MADSIEIQGSGGGEGQTQLESPPPPQEVKPVEAIKSEEIPVVSDATPALTPDSKAVENAAQNIISAVSGEESITEVKAEAKDVEGKKEVTDDILAVAEVKAENVPAQDGVINGDSGSSDLLANRFRTYRTKNDELQRKSVAELDKVKDEKSADSLKIELKVREDEIDLLKARVKNLETELQAAFSKPGSKNHEMIENIKHQHEELLSKARGMIFDQTKMVKNQELQIEALTTQVQSLKDINLITKDLLEIRNSEIKAMEDRLHAMEERFKTEKQRYGLVLERAQTSSNINDDLKKEYEMQLKIFKELRSKYEQKVEALVAENNKLKLDLAKSTGSGTSTEAPK